MALLIARNLIGQRLGSLKAELAEKLGAVIDPDIGNQPAFTPGDRNRLPVQQVFRQKRTQIAPQSNLRRVGVVQKGLVGSVNRHRMRHGMRQRRKLQAA